MNLFRSFIKLTFMGEMVSDTIANFIRQEIDYFKSERAKIADDNLNTEKGYISEGVAFRERYISIWEWEIECILQEHDLKIAKLEKLLEEVEQGILDNNV